jgi:hypothetical protein
LSFDPDLQAQAYPENAKRNMSDATPDREVVAAADLDVRPMRRPPPTATGSGTMKKVPAIDRMTGTQTRNGQGSGWNPGCFRLRA